MLNITLNDNEIQNSNIKQMLETMSQKEIKELFINFLENRLNNGNRWSNFVKDIEDLKISNISSEVAKTSKEFRDSFNIREVN